MNRPANSSFVVTTLLLSSLACGTIGYVSGSKESGQRLETRLQEAERLLERRQEENIQVLQRVAKVRERLESKFPELADELLYANRLIQLHPDVISEMRRNGEIE